MHCFWWWAHLLRIDFKICSLVPACNFSDILLLLFCHVLLTMFIRHKLDDGSALASPNLSSFYTDVQRNYASTQRSIQGWLYFNCYNRYFVSWKFWWGIINMQQGPIVYTQNGLKGIKHYIWWGECLPGKIKHLCLEVCWTIVAACNLKCTYEQKKTYSTDFLRILALIEPMLSPCLFFLFVLFFGS